MKRCTFFSESDSESTPSKPIAKSKDDKFGKECMKQGGTHISEHKKGTNLTETKDRSSLNRKRSNELIYTARNWKRSSLWNDSSDSENSPVEKKRTRVEILRRSLLRRNYSKRKAIVQNASQLKTIPEAKPTTGSLAPNPKSPSTNKAREPFFAKVTKAKNHWDQALYKGDVKAGRITWKPDRFYLNALEGEKIVPCETEWQQRFSLPYLMTDLLERGKLHCVILATYCVDLPNLKKNCPLLFDPRTTVPTLVLHGEKKRMRKEGKSHQRMSPGMYTLSKEKKTVDDADEADSGGEGTVPNFNWTVQLPTSMEVFPVLCSEEKGGERVRLTGGCHHPKYALLFTSSSLIVVVSTGNLVTQRTLDSSWCQNFRKRHSGNTQDSLNKCRRNDFGLVLEDFIRKQSEHMENSVLVQSLARELSRTDLQQLSQNTPCRFIERHLGIRRLSECFDFESAQADLVPTVPGKFPLTSESNVEYGQRRVHQLLKRKRGSMGRQLNLKDSLIMQPTSIGGTKDSNMDYLLGSIASSLVPEEVDGDKTSPNFLKIYWPLKTFVKQCCGSDDPSNAVFMTAQIFGELQPDVWENFHMYHPRFGAAVLPHNKAFLRIDNANNHFHEGESCSKLQLAWYLLTSACLSEGAQGAIRHTKKKAYLECKSFELGILFHSSSSPQSSMYGSAPCTSCIKNNRKVPEASVNNRQKKYIPLPIPFCLHNDKYYDPEKGEWLGKMYWNSKDRYQMYAVTRTIEDMKTPPFSRNQARPAKDTLQISNSKVCNRGQPVFKTKILF